MPEYCVYGLVDPRYPKNIRYVGCTRQTLKKRLQNHIADSSRWSGPRELWVAGILREGFRPIIIHLETVSEDENWEDREKYYISCFSKEAPLLNLTLGGLGNHGWSPTEEARKKIRSGLFGKSASEETRRKLSIAIRESSLMKDNLKRLHISNTGKKRTEEQRARISASLKGRKNYSLMKPVRCIETGQEFESSMAASSFLGKCDAAVGGSIRSKCRCGELHWEYILEDAK